MTRILFASSEAQPLIKTGGLGDVSASLPAALKALRHSVRLVLPGYRPVLARFKRLKCIAELRLPGTGEQARILEGRMPDSGVQVWLVDIPGHFDRDGAPYTGPDGHDWPDNAARFAAFCRAVVELACGRAGLKWRPEVVHCNDWQSGLVPALLSLEASRPASVFTIHNLAYQGLFGGEEFVRLALPPALWSMHGLEFHGMFSFIKGGLAFADRLTTVSPTYAEEIRTPAFGYGLEGLLEYRAGRLHGILNGADYAIWDPAHDPHIARPYGPKSLRLKVENKRALQRRFGLPEDEALPLIGMVGRLVEQKGVDLLLEALPALFKRPLQLVLLGSGEARFEKALRRQARTHPERLGVEIGYDEALAHQVEAGADLFLMPSRFEPCGLNQIYSLRYATLPIVHRTGGLADTVVETTPATRKAGTATGFVFEHPTAEGLLWAVNQALTLYPHPRLWRQLMLSAMAQEFSWEKSARAYARLYTQARADARSQQA